ncbi:MAG: DUF4432 family protein [Clostridia bacterium]|nr:DUF4432 family protein [Clostridia bacterium]
MKGQLSNLMQIACIKRYTLSGGKENGIRVVEIDNGVLRILLNESKNLDVMQVFHKGVNLSFVSKNGFTAREIPFLNRFEGGMIYTCGLDSLGGREGFELHGSLHNYPATVISTICQEDKIEVISKTEVTSLFGGNLLLERKITTAPLLNTFKVEDTLTNLGTKDDKYCLLYHINLGYPMLDEGAKIVMDEEEVIARTPWAKKHQESRKIFEKPIDNEEERCYFITHSKPEVKVINDKLNKTFTLRYSKDTLPKFVQWNSPATQDYALGIEPTTTYLDDYFKYSPIKASEKINFSLEIEVE